MFYKAEEIVLFIVSSPNSLELQWNTFWAKWLMSHANTSQALKKNVL